MLRFSRMLATRLRQLAGPRHRASGNKRPAGVDAWTRLQRALTQSELHPHAARQRELAQENVRLTVTLVGQQGGAAVARIRAACDGDASSAGSAVNVALAVAATLGHHLD